MARKILFTSFKGGTGVTVCSVNVALALARMGERTLVVDGDRLCGNALIYAAMENKQTYTLADFEQGACRAKQAIVFDQRDNFAVMSLIGLRDKQTLNRAIEEIDGLFDYIIFDNISAKCVSEAVIVTEPFLPSIKSSDVCRSNLLDSGYKGINLIVNKISGGQILNGEVMTAEEISKLLRLKLVGVIPEDLFLSTGDITTKTVKAFSLCARNLRQGESEKFNLVKGYVGVKGAIKRKMRRFV